MPTGRYHLTVVADRELTDAEAAALPDGWTRNPRQHHYVQVPALAAETIGSACDTAADAVAACSTGDPPARCAWIHVRTEGRPPFGTPG